MNKNVKAVYNSAIQLDAKDFSSLMESLNSYALDQANAWAGAVGCKVVATSKEVAPAIETVETKSKVKVAEEKVTATETITKEIIKEAVKEAAEEKAKAKKGKKKEENTKENEYEKDRVFYDTKGLDSDYKVGGMVGGEDRVITCLPPIDMKFPTTVVGQCVVNGIASNFWYSTYFKYAMIYTLDNSITKENIYNMTLQIREALPEGIICMSPSTGVDPIRHNHEARYYYDELSEGRFIYSNPDGSFVGYMDGICFKVGRTGKMVYNDMRYYLSKTWRNASKEIREAYRELRDRAFGGLDLPIDNSGHMTKEEKEEAKAKAIAEAKAKDSAPVGKAKDSVKVDKEKAKEVISGTVDDTNPDDINNYDVDNDEYEEELDGDFEYEDEEYKDEEYEDEDFDNEYDFSNIKTKFNNKGMFADCGK